MIQENLWYFGEIFCKMYFFWPGRCRHYIIFYDKKNKLYGPFLWIGFNCLKARATLNLPLEATSRTSCSPLFYSKVALTLALVHSKYTRNKAIVIIRIQWWMNYLLLSYPDSFSPWCCSLKIIVSNLKLFWKIFRKFTRKSPWPLFQPLALKKNLLTGVFLWIFLTLFRTVAFIKHFWAAVSVFLSTT